MGYYRSLLNDQAKKTCDQLEKGLLAVRECILMPRNSFQYIQTALIALQMDQPELFYADCGGMRFEQGRLMAACIATYDDDAVSIAKRKLILSQRAKQIVSPLKGKSDQQIVLAVHDHLVKNVRHGAPKGDERALTAEGALVDRAAWGMGLARAFVYLTALAGIESMMVIGRYKDQPDAQHAWNIVRLSGRYHHVDVMGDHLFSGYPTRTCVNLSDQRAGRRLEPFLIYPLPVCAADASPIPDARKPDELIRVLRTAISRGERMIQVSVRHRFKDIDEINGLLRRKISPQDYSWYSRIGQVLYEPEWDVISFLLE